MIIMAQKKGSTSNRSGRASQKNDTLEQILSRLDSLSEEVAQLKNQQNNTQNQQNNVPYEGEAMFGTAPGPTIGPMVKDHSNQSNFDEQVAKQEGQGIGDIESNAELAKLNLAAEGQQAEVVGEEAGLEEVLRLNVLEEKSNLLPSKIGPDERGNYLPLLHSKIYAARDGNGRMIRDPRNPEQPMYSFSATYGYRWWQWLFYGRGRGIRRDSLIDSMYNHAKNARVPFGSEFARHELNPSVGGDDFKLKAYGPVRRNILKGIFTGARVEINSIGYVSDTKLKKFILALEPEGGKERAYNEENA